MFQEVTEEKFNEMHECLPPIYLTEIDNKPTKGTAFALMEAFTHCSTTGAAVLSLYWQQDGKFYTAFGVVVFDNGQPVTWPETVVWMKLAARTVSVSETYPHTINYLQPWKQQ